MVYYWCIAGGRNMISMVSAAHGEDASLLYKHNRTRTHRLNTMILHLARMHKLQVPTIADEHGMANVRQQTRLPPNQTCHSRIVEGSHPAPSEHLTMYEHCQYL